MNYKFFPKNEDKLNFVMEIYEGEISNRRDWINESVIRLNEALSEQLSPSIIIHYAMTIINHAMVVVRIIDREAISSKKSNKAKSKERAEILHNRNPGLPEPPVNLRKIRNDFEHFEERLDEWASAPNPNIHIDLNMGI